MTRSKSHEPTEPLALASVYLPDGRTAYRVDDALEITSRALYPDDESASDAHYLRQEVTRQAHRAALERAVERGQVNVLNATTGTRHEMPTGAALLRALIPRDELQKFARSELRVELKLSSGDAQDEARRASGLFTLEEATDEITAEQGLNQGERDRLLKDMCESAGRSLIVRHPQSTNPYSHPPREVRVFYELVTRDDVNAWLDAIGNRRYRWGERADIPLKLADLCEPASATQQSSPRPNAPSANAVTEHRLANRRDNILNSAIGKAIEAAKSKSTSAVWLQLRDLALQEEPPFTGAISDAGLAYTDEKNRSATFTRDALRKRLRPPVNGRVRP